MDKQNTVFRMIFTLVAIAVVVSVALAFVNTKTEPVILQNNENQLQESLKSVIRAEKFEILSETEQETVYAAKNGETVVGYCVVNSQKGYGGDVKVMTGVDTNGKVTAIEILEHAETPGLGANAEKDAFKFQFAGKTKEIGVEKNNPGENDIQAISGATITSKAVTNAVNAAIQKAEEAAAK